MKITFLGTGTSQGIPVIACKCKVCNSVSDFDKRLRTSIFIQSKGINLVVDTGPDFRQQMLRAGIERLDGILYTHSHKDHTAGLDDIRAFNYVQNDALDLFGTESLFEDLKSQYNYIFHKYSYPGIPQIRLNEIQNKKFQIGPVSILPVEVLHYKVKVFGFRIEGFTYITDANFIEESEKKKILGSEVLVLNALRKEKHISHFNLEEALDLIEELKPKTAYLTHLSHQMGLHSEVSSLLPENVNLAYDGLELEL